MCAALNKALEIVQEHAKTYPDSFPPTVINITDGWPTDGDWSKLKNNAQKINSVSTNDGPCLLHEAVEIERTTSYHGSAIHMIEAKTSRKGPALRCLARLGKDALQTLLEEAEQRLDESNTLHVRVQFNALMNGEVVLAQAGEESVKGHTKVQVFPGQEGLSEARSTIEAAIAIASEEGQ